MPPYKFVAGEQVIKAQEVKRFPVLAAGPLFQRDPNIVQAFESDDDFLGWARTTELAAKLLKAHGASVAVRDKHRDGDHREIAERQQKEFDEATEAVRTLAKKEGMALQSPELFALIGKRWSLDPVLLFEDVNLGGDVAFLSAGPWGWPNFTWMKRYRGGTWNDIASSGVALGVGFLAEHIWFGGRKFWFGGLPFWSFNLTDFGFDDIASSAWLL